MSKLLHLKASNVKILTTLPNKDFGKEGDIVICHIKGKGTFMCSKARGIWYVSSRMSEMSRLDKTPLDINAKKINIKNIKNSSKGDKFVVSESDGELKYRTSDELLSDINSDSMSVNYKTAFCSLGQYTNKEECEANNGTWYYSENESHDSISSTAENQLLTIGQSIGTLDSEPTLLYDGSTLEIKRNTDYDDNWQTSANTNLLKLSYDSTNYTTIGTSNVGLTEITSSGSIIYLGGNTIISTISEIGSDTDKFLMSDSGTIKYVTGANLRSYIGAGTSSFGGALNDLSDVTYSSGDLTITSLDKIVASTLQLKLGDGDQAAFNLHSDDAGASHYSHTFGLELDNYSSFRMNERGGSSNSDYFDIFVNEHGATTISTVDAAAANANLTFDVDGDIELNADGGNIVFKDDTALIMDINSTDVKFHYPTGAGSYFSIDVGTRGTTVLSTEDESNTGTGHIIFEPEGGVYIKERATTMADLDGYGQLAVLDTTPNKLVFTNDAGDDIVITSGSELYQKYVYDSQFVGYSAAALAVYLPMNGYVVDVTSVSTRNEFASFIAPYNGTIEKFAFRSEIAQDGAFRILVQESSDGTEVPGTTSFRIDTTYDIADDTYQELALTSPSIGSDNVPMTKGKIYAIQLTTPAISYDSNVTIVFKWDITS